MKVKITVTPKELDKQVELHFARRYSRWVDYATFYNSKAVVKLDVIDLIFNIKMDILALRKENIASLLYSKRGKYTQLDFYVLNKIKNSILYHHRGRLQNAS
ncbi:MAG: hypothetical protein AB2L20_15055 [Mangrovibacterium sp.]